LDVNYLILELCLIFRVFVHAMCLLSAETSRYFRRSNGKSRAHML
jgi:hypothetical protein